MNQNEIKDQVVKLLRIVAPDTNPEDIKPNEDFRKSLGIDSFDFLTFVVSLDETFGIETPEEDYGKISTMDDLVNYLSERIALV